MTFNFNRGDIHITYDPETELCTVACSDALREFSPTGDMAKRVDNLVSRLSDLEEGELLRKLVEGKGEYCYTLHGYSDSVWNKIRGY